MLAYNAHVVIVDRRPGDSQRSATRPSNPCWMVRLAARLRSRALDQALGDGADPAARPQLAARAATLTTPSMRAEIANGLERLARTGIEPRTPWRVRPFRSAVHANATELHALAALLRGSTPVHARGVALLRTLLTDGTGPAYTDRQGGALARQLRHARTAVGG
jgi:hypothetical protein